MSAMLPAHPLLQLLEPVEYQHQFVALRCDVLQHHEPLIVGRDVVLRVPWVAVVVSGREQDTVLPHHERHGILVEQLAAAVGPHGF